MYSLKIQNASGDLFELTHNPAYAIIGVQGVTTPAISINTSVCGLFDGEFFNSARMGMRNLVIDIVINGDIEANRKELYRIFSIKKPCMIYFENVNRSVKIAGYVEVIEGDLFAMRQQMQVSILCPQPYWQGLYDIYGEISTTMKRFAFPFSISEDAPVPISTVEDAPVLDIYNPGDVECGFIAQMTFSVSVAVPKIINTETGEFIGIGYLMTTSASISTVSGNLYAKNSDGDDITGLLSQGSTWFKLKPGHNLLTYSTDNSTENKMTVSITASPLYGGV